MIFSGPERQAPKTVLETEPSHLARYRFASEFIKSKDLVLDVPCGSGYGSNLISAKAQKVVGVDNNFGAIQHAKEFFHANNTEFLIADMESLMDFFSEDLKFDVIVSFEGIEHIKRQDFFLSQVRKLLKTDGYFVISTPRKPHGSIFHTREFSLEEFYQILSRDFIVEKMFGQIYTDIFDMDKRPENPHFYKKFNFIAICKPKSE